MVRNAFSHNRERLLLQLELMEKCLEAEIAFWSTLERSWLYRWPLIPGWPVRLLRRGALAYQRFMIEQVRHLYATAKTQAEVVRRAYRERFGFLWFITAEGLVRLSPLYDRISRIRKFLYRFWSLYMLFFEFAFSVATYYAVLMILTTYMGR